MDVSVMVPLMEAGLAAIGKGAAGRGAGSCARRQGPIANKTATAVKARRLFFKGSTSCPKDVFGNLLDALCLRQGDVQILAKCLQS